MGATLVFLSAFFWSLGGTIARMLETGDDWAIVFWRSCSAAAFILAFLFWRDGFRGTLALFAAMRGPGLAVAACFAFCSSAFVIALSYTTVANILIIQAGVPLFAALLAFVLFGERVAPTTWAAIALVIGGVAIMVSESFTGKVSPIGDGLALLITLCLAVATVITRRYSHVRMVPATCLGVVIAGCFAATQTGSFAVSAHDAVWLFVFGAINLGLGLALFATGVRLIPAPLAALLGCFEPILGPIWVWLAHGETPSARAMVGGAVVMTALIGYLMLEFRKRSVAPA